MAWKQYRTIVEDSEVTEALAKFRQEWSRFSEAWDALVWLLARKGEDLGRKNAVNAQIRLYAQAANMLAGTPRLAVVFSATVDEIVIHGVRAEGGEEAPKDENT